MATHNLIRVQDVIPMHQTHVFPWECFNTFQSIVLPQALNTDNTMVVAAPTGCGKTVIHELAILRQLNLNKKSATKILYIAPTKALCQQKFVEWSAMFTPLGLNVVELTVSNIVIIIFIRFIYP